MNGDLTKRINATNKTGEIAELSNGVNSLIDVLSALIQQIRSTAGDGRPKRCGREGNQVADQGKRWPGCQRPVVPSSIKCGPWTS
jgi:uncharacterized protein YunC (DUF1805 family)